MKEVLTIDNFDISSDYPIRIVNENLLLPFDKAMELSESKNLTLIVVNQPKDETSPYICKLVNLKEYIMERKKKDKEIKQNNQNIHKEIRVTVNIGVNDLNRKKEQTIKFLKEKSRVSIVVPLKKKERTEEFKIKVTNFLQKINEDINTQLKINNKPINITYNQKQIILNINYV